MDSGIEMPAGNPTSLPEESVSIRTVQTHLNELFVETARSIHRYIPLQRAVLVAVRDHYRDLIAVAGWSLFGKEGGLRTLSLTLPAEDSLFAQVAAQRFGFSDDYFGLFSGNRIERGLLIDNLTRSYVIWPLKTESSLVGLVGLSSEYAGAFIELEAIDPERTFAPLTTELARLRNEHHLAAI